MKEEHNHSGALEALDRVLDDYNHGITGNRTVQDNERDIELVRAALSAAKMRYELDEVGVPLPLSVQMSWKKPMILKAYAEGLSTRACGRVFDVSHETCAQIVKFAPKPPQDGGDDE